MMRPVFDFGAESRGATTPRNITHPLSDSHERRGDSVPSACGATGAPSGRRSAVNPARGPGDPPVDDPAREFARLLEPLIPTLFRHAYRWTAARDQAEDLVQELLVRLYPQMTKLAGLERVEPWALRVMYRIFVDQHRRS